MNDVHAGYLRRSRENDNLDNLTRLFGCLDMQTVDPLAGVSVFLNLAEQLSFSATAERLGLSRATVSAQLTALERRLGVRLFQRTTRHVSLTEAGRAYRDTLGGVLNQVSEAERVALSYQREAVGRLRLAAPVEFGLWYIVPVLKDYLKTRPQLMIDLDLSDTPVDVVAAGFDLAIRGTMNVEPNLIVRRLGVSSVRLAASRGYLKDRGTPKAPEDLAAHDCLHFAGLRWGRLWVLSRNGVERRVPIRPRIEINNGGALRAAAVAGLGITLLPMFLIGEDLRAGRLVEVLPEWTIGTVPVNAVYPANRHIAAKVRAFVDVLAREFARIPDIGAAAASSPRKRAARR
jgi:DNA-binding transcriptional LysR family regulator